MNRFLKPLSGVEVQEKEKKEVNQVGEFEGRTRKKAFGSGWQGKGLGGIKGEDQCENIHVFILVVLIATIFKWEKAKRVKNFGK
ncbi:unnamed protein product [Sphenostylis stenocarpa]|uniref:Uncharacterized protein n=1 Tax=Sphenostylis stenocarpa TaxID=92480 RepID=A0AA86S1X0_9FABA|nr:unnamed protein product [Sphenostylis stenocarpa]